MYRQPVARRQRPLLPLRHSHANAERYSYRYAKADAHAAASGAHAQAASHTGAETVIARESISDR